MVVFNPKIHNNYLIFTVVLKDKEEEEVVDKGAKMVAEQLSITFLLTGRG